MLRLDKVIKPWKESACLNDHINLYGFWNETAFLTKSGDVGMVLSVLGVDYESLDRSEQEYAVKRLDAALKAFGPGFHVYQYLFKSNRPDIPFSKYDDPIVEAAIEQRRKFFEAKRDRLYQVEIFYCILLEGARSKTGRIDHPSREGGCRSLPHGQSRPEHDHANRQYECAEFPHLISPCWLRYASLPPSNKELDSCSLTTDHTASQLESQRVILC
jgi:type IV secretory pathway VirB4 component